MTQLFAQNEVHVGRDMGGHEYQITPELVANFIAGTGDDNPWYRDRSPLGPPIAPALILHSEVYTTLSWYLSNLYGNLHTRQEWEVFSPVAVGEKLRTRCVIVDRYFKRDREFVVNEALVFNSEGRMVSRSRTHQSFLRGRAEGIVIDKSREKAPGRSFNVGERGGEPLDSVPSRQITEAMCQAFSGPEKNYHTDRQAARDLGFPDIVVQGMLSVCLIAEMMTGRFGMGFFCGGKLNLSLVNILWGNDTTGPRGSIVERHPEGEHTRAEAEVWCQKADGTKTVVGTASALEL